MTKTNIQLLQSLLLTATMFLANAPAADTVHTDAEVAGKVSFNPVIGDQVPLNLKFGGMNDQKVLGDLLKEKQATLITFAWFDCENLCGLVMNALADGGGRLSPEANYQVIVVSMDAAADQRQAVVKKQDLVTRYPVGKVDTQWRFLTGTEQNISELADSLGYHFTYDPRKQQFAHAVGVIALDRHGYIRNFATGINYPSQVLTQMISSTDGNAITASPPHPLLLLCYDYDPSSGRYSLAVMKVLRLIALAFLLLLGGTYWYWHRGQRKRDHG